MQKKKLINIFNILLVVISMLTIFLFSSENSNKSSETSKKVVKEVVTLVTKEVNDPIKLEKKVDDNILIIRKCAHLIEYFILGFLLINVFKDYKNISKKTLIICILLTCLYACTDEFHQLHVVGRTAKYLDILIDTFGSFLGIMTYYLIYKRFHKNNQEIA